MEQKISLNNIQNFIKYIGPKINANLADLIVDFDKTNSGLLFINLEDKYIKEKISFCVSKNSFRMFIDEKEIDLSSDWQRYLDESYSMDMNLYFQNEGSRFG